MTPLLRRFVAPGLGALAVALVAALAASRTADGDRETTLIELPGELPLSLTLARFEPTSAVLSARVHAAGWLALERHASERVRVELPGMCALDLPARRRAFASPRVQLRPMIDLGGDRMQIGYDSELAIDVLRGCPEQGGRGRVVWRQLAGPALRALSISDDGFRLRARTLPFSAFFSALPALGLIPVSPRSQGRYVLEARWSGRTSELAPVRRTVTVTSTARATGVPSTAVAQQLLLAGPGWRVLHAPTGGHAQVQPRGTHAEFTPDAPGRWTLTDETAHQLSLQASWHHKTPMDCGRPECHAAIAEAARTSPMSFALERHILKGEHGPRSGLACLLPCHVTGEAGVRDGGFVDLATKLGFTGLGAAKWSDLPPGLQRLGGVRCTSCHGPAAVPEPAARRALLRSDVCATCHDAPPTYVHVEQWRVSAMARSDAAPRTRTEPGCARCHTTGGFLADQRGQHEHATDATDPQAEPGGIACPACHAPHAAHGDKLVRDVSAASLQATAGSLTPRERLCAACHAPVAGEPLPAASSAVLWAGRVLLPPAASSPADAPWETAEGPSPHQHVSGGCIGCHGGRAAPGARTTDHSFRVPAGVCSTCHPGGAPEEAAHTGQPSLRARASALHDEIASRCKLSAGLEPPHQEGSSAAGACTSRTLSRARFVVLLVLEDRGAHVHNAPFARGLLAEAERLLRLDPASLHTAASGWTESASP